MKLKKTPELYSFFSSQFLDPDSSKDEDLARHFIAASTIELREQIIAQGKALLMDGDFPIDELGSEANRWFVDADEARAWLAALITILEGAHAERVVKDSNGVILSENDAVTVIKDLKVKGGSSDLKRGTLIKKIHLIDDPEAVECRVDGSTLVLKTCFLKKA